MVPPQCSYKQKGINWKMRSPHRSAIPSRPATFLLKITWDHSFHQITADYCGWGFYIQQKNIRPASLQAFALYGAGTKSRTRDLLITSQLLYQLSYTG